MVRHRIQPAVARCATLAAAQRLAAAHQRITSEAAAASQQAIQHAFLCWAVCYCAVAGFLAWCGLMKFHRPSMPKIFNFTRFSLRDLIVTAGPATFVIVLICLLAYWLVDPTPPSHVTISTGQDNSAYEEIAKIFVLVLVLLFFRVSF